MKKSRFFLLATALTVVCLLLFCACESSQETAEETTMEATQDQVVEETTEATTTEASSETSQPGTDWAGTWEDSTSQRAWMTITDQGAGSYSVEIHWGGSATETSIWTFGSSDADDSTIQYSDCTHKNVTTDEEGNESEEILYQGGSGSLKMDGGNITWTDDMEDAGAGCVFVRGQ